MTWENLSEELIDWSKQIEEYLVTENYDRGIEICEQIIGVEPENQFYYWYLGLLLLLKGEEEQAQTTWLVAMAETEEWEESTKELVIVLQREATRRETIQDYSVAWAIYQHIRELEQNNINILLKIVLLSIKAEVYRGEEFSELGIIQLLKSKQSLEIEQTLLLNVIQEVLHYARFVPSSLDFTKACIHYIEEPLKFADILLAFIYETAYSYKGQPTAIKFCEIGLELMPEHRELLRAFTAFHIDIGKYAVGMKYALLCSSLAGSLCDLVYDNYMLIKATLESGGYREELNSAVQKHKTLLNDLFTEKPSGLGATTPLIRLYTANFCFPYIQDRPQENLKLRQKIALVCQSNIEESYGEIVTRNQQKFERDRVHSFNENKLKIGFISHCLRRHSVGWLTKTLFQHYDREKFEFYGYLLAYGNSEEKEPLQEWYIKQMTKACGFKNFNAINAVEQIYQDGVDILVDLDSLTLNTTCTIMALRPAPIQVTWLGWDTSEIPTIDYFIADPYVLPDNADNYYAEKIWRLPNTYIAIDGFDTAVPTLRKNTLDIPSDAIVYYTSQKGPKYNPNTIRMQMKIIQAVPDSYFLMKGYGEHDSLKEFLIQIAAEEGVKADRLIFTSRDNSEETHRANLKIADIILDTYPYNGATTTMETLWMEIPMVTRVGEQFAARNSYTMMMNAGITEGIAWNDEEYVEWGIKLGTDEKLRQQVSWKLKKSKRSAPLWNGKQFTREMENAYRQMWQTYTEGAN